MSLPPYGGGWAGFQRDNVVPVGLALAVSAGITLGVIAALAWLLLR